MDTDPSTEDQGLQAMDSDLRTAGQGCLDARYADVVTKIITAPGKSKNTKLKVEREIDRINRYEPKWKIKTSEEKFLDNPTCPI